MNKVILSGNLTKDIEVIKKENICLGKFTLAVSRPYKNNNGKYESDFFNCVIFNANDYIKDNLKKGTKILLDGIIQTKSYEVEGTKKYSTDIVVNKIEILIKKEEDNLDKLTTKTDFDKTGQIEISEEDYPF
jgi:single-strand DNA-binding protein